MAFLFAGQYLQVADNTSGQLLKNQPFTVYSPPGQTATLATLYTDRTATVTASNPSTTSAIGNLSFFAMPGRYDVLMNGTTITVTVYPDPAELGVQKIAHGVNAFSQGAGAFNIDASLGDVQQITLTGNAGTPTITNPTLGQFLTVEWVQDATGGRTYSWPVNWKWNGSAINASTAANARDSATARYDGTNWQVVGTALNGPVMSGGLFLDGSAPIYGLVNDGAVSDQTTKLQAFVNAIPIGGVGLLPPWKIKFSTLTVPPLVILKGSGWSWLRDGIGTFGQATTANLANYGGTVLVSTATTGSALSQTPTATQTGGIRDLLVLGPGSGTSIGLDLGSATQTIVESVYDVAVVNFATGARVRQLEECQISLRALSAATTGVSIVTSTNNNEFHLLDIQKCSGTPLSIDQTSDGNVFSALILQSNTAASSVDGHWNTFLNPWIESSNDGTKSVTFGATSSARVTIISPNLGVAADAIILGANTTDYVVLNFNTTGGITNQGSGLFFVGNTGQLTDTGTNTQYIDHINNKSLLLPAAWTDVAAGVGFVNSWVNAGGGIANVSFRKSVDGKFVELVGSPKGGSAGTIFTLPAGFRPITTVRWLTAQNLSAGGTTSVNVTTTGAVISGVSGAGVQISLDGLRFPIDI